MNPKIARIEIITEKYLGAPPETYCVIERHDPTNREYAYRERVYPIRDPKRLARVRKVQNALAYAWMGWERGMTFSEVREKYFPNIEILDNTQKTTDWTNRPEWYP